MDSATDSIADCRSVVIGYNPRSGSGDRTALVERLASQLNESGMETFASPRIDEAVGRANELYRLGMLRAFVSGGGDGTIRTMAELLQPGVPIAIFPLGTENLLARHFRIDRSVESVVSRVVRGTRQKFDAGLANGKLFLVMASCGFDADVVRRFHSRRKGNIRRWSYFGPAWEALWKYPFPALRVRTDTGETIENHRWVFVFNCPRYALDLRMSPAADTQDGLLDLRTFRRGSLIPGLAYVAAIFLGQHERLMNSIGRQVKSVRIESDSEVPFQLDGDPGGILPLEIEVAPGRLTLLVETYPLR